MISKKVDGKEQIHMIHYFNGGITLDNYREAVELEIDENHWSSVMEVKEVVYLKDRTEDGGFVIDQNIKGASEYFSKYWVDTPFYENILLVGTELGLPKKHIENLIVPLSHLEMETSLIHSDSLKRTAREFDDLIDVIESLKEIGVKIESLTIRTGLEIGRDPKTSKPKMGGLRSVKFKEEMLLTLLRDLLLKWAETSPSYASNILKSRYRGYSGYSFKNTKKFRENTMVLIVYQYIMKHGLGLSDTVMNIVDSGHTNASRMTGYLIETAKLTRLLDKLRHLESVQRKRQYFETLPEAISGERKNPNDILRAIHRLDLEGKLKKHSFGEAIQNKTHGYIGDNLQWVMEKIQQDIEDMSLHCTNSYDNEKITDSYRKLIEDNLKRREKE